jgi:hypothetical protein
MMKKFVKVITIVALFVGLSSCTDNNDSGELSSVAIKLVDRPGDYEKVNVEVIDVLIKRKAVEENATDSTSTDQESGWESVGNVTTGIYDLLELTGGVDALLVEGDIPSGMLGQIRLVLGENNTVVINGVEFPLKTPSAQQSGLKLKVNEELEAGIGYTFILDFNVDKSIVMAGNSGNINLKPVINVSVEAVSGKISGTINPAEVQTEITATDGTNTVSAFADANGVFVLNGVSPGTYTVTTVPAGASGLAEKTISDVEVVAGENTDLGEIVLE